MKFLSACKKYGPKAAATAVIALAAAPTFAAGLIDWGSLATSTIAEVTAAITAGIGVLALFFGVGGGVAMFRKFIG